MTITKDISPFLHQNLYHYPRFECFNDVAAVGLTQWGVLSKTVVADLATVPVYVIETPSCADTPVADPDISPNTGAGQPSTSYADTTPLPMTSPTVDPDPTPAPEPTPASTRFAPRKPDSLFWSLYIAHYGVADFRQIGNKYMNREIEEKFRIVTFMNQNRPLMKSMKLTQDQVQEIMGDITTNRETQLTMVRVFAMFYKVHIWVIDEATKTYFEFRPSPEPDPDTPVYLLYRVPGRPGRFDYVVDTHVRADTLAQIHDTMVRLESPHQPLRSISNYKVTDLEKIATDLGIPPPEGTKKWKKGEIYQAILTHCTLTWSVR
jgi:hypothetical protein